MGQENIVLTGFMGSGKSAVGKELAKQLGYRFLDTDQLIEEHAGRTVAEIFRSEGEESFRRWERMISEELSAQHGAVIATGGRLMLDARNAELLGGTGPVFCLTAPAAEIARRLHAEPGKRPLLDAPDAQERIARLLAQRAGGYARFPQIETQGRSVEAIARKIRNLMDKRIIDVTHPDGRYAVVIGPDLLADLRDLAEIEGPLAVITDSNVGPLYAHLIDADIVLTMPAGEQHKTLATVNELYSRLLSAGLDRQGTVVALGGGVVGDVAGFVAATYMRGVDFVQAPTSLLAMVDASVGGKTGVDLPEGKNLVGAFKQPKAVLIDLQTLSTLPAAEFSSGMAEVIKAGIIADPQLFALIESRAKRGQLRAGDLQLLQRVVGDAVEMKRLIVEEDPYEDGRRAFLNLGHTFGHAIEQVTGYGIRHGQGVAMGLVAAAHLAIARDEASADLESRTASVLASVGLPTSIPTDLRAEAIYAAMASDKKKKSGQLRFILPRQVGEVFISDQVSREQVLNTLRHCGAQ